mgnify:CR=1 FL=1
MAGLYFEELTPGLEIKHPWGRTVTESDNVMFSCLTLNPQPLHIDAEFAAKTEFGKPLVNSLFTLGLMIGMSVNDTTMGTLVANLDKPDTLSTLTKSSIDWDTYKHEKGVEDELAGASKGGFVEKQAFLARVDGRRDELYREHRGAEKRGGEGGST